MTQDTDATTIARQLEEDIVLGRILPRERLPEDALMARFGVKRHVARQALQYLSATGVLDHVPNRGAQVRAFTADQVHDLYALRDLLETAAAALIPLPLPDTAVATLRAAQAPHDLAVAAGDAAAVFRANLAFHRALFALCPNPFLVEAIEAASARAHGIRFAALRDPAAMERARGEHHAMIAAAAEGRRDDLVRLCRDHLPASCKAYLGYAVTP